MTEAVYYILLSVVTPLHGYGIMQNAAKLSNNRVNLAAGTLYGAINACLDKGWITTAASCGDDNNSRKKAYQITDVGKEAVGAEIARLRELLTNGEQIIGRCN